MRYKTGGEIPEAHFDLTPMIDVVLLLIIFFTLTAQFADALKTPLDLPAEEGAGRPETSDTAVFIDITKEGELRLAAEPISFEELLQRLSNDMRVLTAAGRSLDLTVRVDRSAPARHVNGLAVALTQLGVRNWKLATAAEGG